MESNLDASLNPDCGASAYPAMQYQQVPPTPSVVPQPTVVVLNTTPAPVRPQRNCWISFLYAVNCLQLIVFTLLLGYIVYLIVDAKADNHETQEQSGHYTKKLMSFAFTEIESAVLKRIAMGLAVIVVGLGLAVASLKTRNRCIIVVYLFFAVAISALMFFIISAALVATEALDPQAKYVIAGLAVLAVANFCTPITILCTCCCCRDDVDFDEATHYRNANVSMPVVVHATSTPQAPTVQYPTAAVAPPGYQSPNTMPAQDQV